MRSLPANGQETIEETAGIRFRIRKSLRRTCQITVEKDGTVTLRMPLLSSEEEARELIAKHRRWILNRIRKNELRETVQNAEEQLSDEEKKNLKAMAKKKIPERVAFFAERIGVNYGTISYRFQKSRWGSCSVKGNLNFNCLLMLAPEEVLDSVIVHELCHRKYMNHSGKFYREIERVFPEYRKNHDWLKKHGDELMGRL